jgi:ElaB/YqjD/DUF883 family membrane-anchored ribosome-binding protein
MQNERDSTPGNGPRQGGYAGSSNAAEGASGGYAGAAGGYSGAGAYGAADEFGGAGGSEMTGSGEIRNLIADVEDLLKGVANVGDADVARLRARVMETVQTAKSTLMDRTETLRTQANDAAAVADDYVRERPWAAIGIAAAIGVAVGLVAGRRTSGSRDDY